MWFGPNERNGEEKDRFWNDFDRIVDRVGNGYRLFMLGNLNRWVRVVITGAFTVPRENYNGRKVIEF